MGLSGTCPVIPLIRSWKAVGTNFKPENMAYGITVFEVGNANGNIRSYWPAVRCGLIERWRYLVVRVAELFLADSKTFVFVPLVRHWTKVLNKALDN